MARLRVSMWPVRTTGRHRAGDLANVHAGRRHLAPADEAPTPGRDPDLLRDPRRDGRDPTAALARVGGRFDGSRRAALAGARGAPLVRDPLDELPCTPVRGERLLPAPGAPVAPDVTPRPADLRRIREPDGREDPEQPRVPVRAADPRDRSIEHPRDRLRERR